MFTTLALLWVRTERKTDKKLSVIGSQWNESCNEEVAKTLNAT